jgi:hypothetical protein
MVGTMKFLHAFSLIAFAVLTINPVFAQKQTDAIVKNEKKLKDIKIPSLEFSDTPLGDALQFLQSKSVELDFVEQDPNKKGINIILRKRGKTSRIRRYLKEIRPVG